MLANKVVKLNTDNIRVYDQIERYINQLGYNSKGTMTAYLGDIKLFFKIIKNKEIEYLTEEDVNSIDLDSFEDFISYMHNLTNDEGKRVYTNKTINRKVSASKGLIEYLYSKKIVADVSYFPSIKSLPENSNSHGVLETHEVFTMAELALQERVKGKIKRLLILFSLDTCIRKAALVNLKWSNFIEKEEGVLVTGVDKGNQEFRQLISKDFYNELLKIKTTKDKVFDISVDAVDKMFVRLRDKMKIPEERRIVFHSIRKSGVTFRFRMTGDILEAQRAANHSNVSTTQLYIKNEDYGALGAVSSRGKLDMEMYKKVDHETLIEAIEMCKKDFQAILNMKLMELDTKE